MPDVTPDPAADARLRKMAQSSLAGEAAAVDTEADLAALRERLAGVTSPVPATRARPAAARWLAAAAAAVLIIAGVTAIAWTRRGNDGSAVAPPAPTAATTVPSAAPTAAPTTAATTTATTNTSATTPETTLPPSDTARAEPSTVAAGSELTITPAGLIQRACDDIVTTLQLDDAVGAGGLVIDGRWEPAPDSDVTRVTYPPCDGVVTNEPLTFVVPADMPTGRYVMCLIEAPASPTDALADPGCALVTVTEESLPACLTEPLAPPSLVDGSAPGEATIEDEVATWGDGVNAVRQVLAESPFGPFDDIAAEFGSLRSGNYEAVVVQVGDGAIGEIAILVTDDPADCVRWYSVGPGVEPAAADALAQQWVDALASTADAACASEPLAPPSLVDGSPPGEASADGEVFTWGEGSNAVRQVLAEQPFGQFDEVAAEFGSLRSGNYEAVVVQVGDGAIGQIAILIRDDPADCVRWYSVGPGIEPSVADALAQQWVDALATGVPAPEPGHPAIARSYFARSHVSVEPFFAIHEFSPEGTLLRTLTTDEVSQLFPQPALRDGTRLQLAPDATGGRCENQPITRPADDGPDGLHPGLPAARSLVTAHDGVVWAGRDVCPDTARWGDPGTHWELVRLDMDAPDPTVDVLMTREPEPDQVLFDDGEVTLAVGEPRVEQISPDGRFAVLSESYNSEQWRWLVLDLESPGAPVELASTCPTPGDIVGPPRFVGADLVVVARLCVSGALPTHPQIGAGDGDVRIEVIRLRENELVWENSVPGLGVHGYNRVVGLSAWFGDDGIVRALLTGGGDIEQAGRAFVVEPEDYTEVTRAGFSDYAFNPADLIEPWDELPAEALSVDGFRG